LKSRKTRVKKLVKAKPKKAVTPVDLPKPKPKNTKRANGLTAEGVKLYNRGKYNESIKKFEAALAVSPGSKQALVAYTRALLEVNRLKDALEAAEKASRADPKNAEIFLLLGNAQQDLGMKTRSIKAYERYLKLAPNGAFASEIKQVIKGIQASTN
jgi:tetratricopeptide (TPR) repeat protein